MPYHPLSLLKKFLKIVNLSVGMQPVRKNSPLTRILKFVLFPVSKIEIAKSKSIMNDG